MAGEQVQNYGQSGEAANAPSVEQEFDAALSDAIGSSSAPGNPAAEAQPGSDQTQGSADAPAPADAAAQQPSADGHASPQGSASDDVWANAPAEIRAAHEQAMRDMDLRVRSANGRVAAFQRQLDQLSTQQQPAEQQGQREAQQPGAGTTGGDYLSDPKIQQLREDFPEVAGPLLDLIAAQQSEISRFGKTAGQFEQQQNQAFLADQQAVLEGQHPDWTQVATDDRFAGWLQTQPTALREAFQRNHDAIVDGADAALVIGKFKQDLGIGTSAPANPAPANDRRQRQLANGRDAGRTSPPVATGIPKNDFDAALDAFIGAGGKG